MAKNVIIHLPHVGEDHVRWALADDKGKLSSAIFSGTFEEAAEKVEGKRATLIVPGNDVLLAEASVPGGSASRALQAIPFALEEQLADDVEQLHFALGGRGKDDVYPVAVIGRDTMDTVQEQCANAGLRPTEIVPETLALPKFESDEPGDASWTALIDADQTVVRLNGFSGFSTDTDMAGIMLEGARSNLEDDASANMVVFRTNSDSPLPETQGVDMETRHCESRLSLYASGLANAPHINLLQGDYSPKTQFDKNWKPWRWSMVLLGVLCAVLMGVKALELRQSANQVKLIDQQIEQAFKQAMPGSRLQRPVKQIENRIAQLSGGSTNGFTSELSQIAASLTTQPQTVVRSISYREGRFDLDVTTDAIPTLDLLKEELKKRGDLSMNVLSANVEKGGLRSRIRIE